jgi:hypothetical protein
MLKSQQPYGLSLIPASSDTVESVGAAGEAVVNKVLKNPKILQFLFGPQVFCELFFLIF